MQNDMLTQKQRMVLHNAIHSPKRWNINVGAVRSGKTYADRCLIPYRVVNADKCGSIALIGYTTETLERNILAPMRDMYSERFVGRIGKNGRVRLFGRDCAALGAYTAACAEKLRGCSLSYAYGDEITSWNEEVFTMLKSRLDRRDSVFDGSCNPDSPFHWFKRFIDSEPQESIRVTHFGITDNTFLPQGFTAALMAEYAGTVYYDRYILGKWCAGQGAVYTAAAADPQSLVTEDLSGIIMADIGVDFGGNGSATAFSLTGYTAGYKRVITLDEYYCRDRLSPEQLEIDLADFVKSALSKYPVRDIYCDSAEQILIRGIENRLARERLPVAVHNARKSPINDRISFYCALMGQKRYFIARHCVHTLQAFCEAVWKDGRRLDNGSTNIDSLDAQEYATERRMKEII